jgi:hypothetical protein
MPHGRASHATIARRERLVRRLLLALLVLPALLSPLRADDDEPFLPFNPFTDAQEGDWESLLYAAGKAGKPEGGHVSTWRVKKVGAETVEVDLETLRPNAPRPEVTHRTFPRQGRIALRDYLKMLPGEKLEGAKVWDRTFTHEGHVFSGTQVECARSGGERAGQIGALFAKEVKGSGVVILETQLGGGRLELHQLVGFGTKEKTLWGKTAEEVPVASGEKSPIHFNLYQDRNYGFSIHAPVFREIQERQVAQVFAVAGGGVSFGVWVQGDTTPRKEFRAKTLEGIEQMGYKLERDEEKRISGKDALEVEYTGTIDTPLGKQKARMIDLVIFREAHAIDVRVTALAETFDGGAGEKAIRNALANVRLIDLGGASDPKREGAGVYFDHRYGYRLPLPELAKIEEGSAGTVVAFQGPVEANGNTSAVGVTVFETATKRSEYELPPFPGFKVVSKKETTVSGRDALRFELKGKANGEPVRGLMLVVFDEKRTFVVEATGSKAAWDEEGEALRTAVASFALDEKK